MKIAVHLHLYYLEQLDYFLAKLENIGTTPFDLFVTMVEDDETAQNKIRAFKPDATIWLVENRGYDVGSFIEFLNKIDLSRYDYVVKLHTKRDMPRSTSTFRGLTGPKWRETALSFLDSPEIFASYLRAFEANPSIGMQANYRLFKCEKGIRFVAGTMFIARAYIFVPLKNQGLSIRSFDSTGEHIDSLAHNLERCFGQLASEQGLLITDVVNDPAEAKLKRLFFRDRFISPLLRFVYQKKTTKSGKQITKILKIPFFRKRNRNFTKNEPSMPGRFNL